MIRGAGLATVVMVASLIGLRAPPDLPVVQANDNLRPAGRLERDTLHLQLVVRRATWYPEGATGPSVAVEAFAEENGPAEIPGPLIRITTGTVIDATVRNALPDSTIRVLGLTTRPATGRDTLVIAPGATGRARFIAGAPGSYFYYAVVGHQSNDSEREQLAGALVIDSAGPRPNDRTFVINIWSQYLDSVTAPNAIGINGKSFPYDEEVTAAVGDTVRWRWINASDRPHPMHLHGFYFRVDGKGDAFGDTTYSAQQRRSAVTEVMRGGQTMTMTWSPERPGHWLFHCHLGFHVMPDYARLVPPGKHDQGSTDVRRHMAGLVMGITVTGPDHAEIAPAGPLLRKTIFVQEGTRRGSHSPRALGYVVQEGEQRPARDSVGRPGTPLILTRGVPTEIVVSNHLPEPTAVHWHGLEVESFWDGVAGWSGSAGAVAPAILPGTRFTAKLALRRAGTFMFHTHLNDASQLTSGLYGPIVVLEPGERFDPTTDHVYIAGWDGLDDPPHLLINGDSLAAPLTLAAGTTHRFRFANVGMAEKFEFAILRDSTLMTWRPRAKDGADLPPWQRLVGPARFKVDVGETFDAEFEPRDPGEYRLVARPPGDSVWWSQKLLVIP